MGLGSRVQGSRAWVLGLQGLGLGSYSGRYPGKQAGRRP